MNKYGDVTFSPVSGPDLHDFVFFLFRCQLQNEEDGKIKLQTLEDCVHKLQTSKVSEDRCEFKLLSWSLQFL